MSAGGYAVRWVDAGGLRRSSWSRLADAILDADRIKDIDPEPELYQVHPDGSEERLPSYEEALALLGVDPLAALEAAERRLLEAGGWREIEPGGRWYHPVIGHRWKGAALADEKSRRRERLAAKGGA